ncbi:MAG: hypothetical protein ACLT2Z_05860 [Eubacterium sp.]
MHNKELEIPVQKWNVLQKEMSHYRQKNIYSDMVMGAARKG